MRVQVAGEHRLPPPGDAGGHGHRFGAGGGTVVHGSVGNLHPGQHGYLGLKLEQHLQRTLGDFRLIGGIGRQELASLDQIIDTSRHMVPVGACTQKARSVAGGVVLHCQALQVALHTEFARKRR